VYIFQGWAYQSIKGENMQGRQVHCKTKLTNHEGNLLISPGDLWDKLVILGIKLERVPKHKELIQEELTNLQEFIHNIHEKVEPDNLLSVCLLVAQLDEIARQQWDQEDIVRTTENLTLAGKAAQDSRTLNTKRVEIKNKINKLYRSFGEVKLYKGEEK